MRTITLQDITIKKECDLDITMLVLGGRKPSAEWLKLLDLYKNLWAVDSGVDSCFEAGILPDKLVGDGDSASFRAWHWAVDNGVDVSKYNRDKDVTDFQIALDTLSHEDDAKKKALFVTGGFAGRFDHLWATVISFLNCAKNLMPIGMADEIEGMIFLRGPEKLNICFDRSPGAISLISFAGESSGVSIKGVRWPLENVLLKYGEPYSISNRLAGGMDIEVSIGDGTIGVYWTWEA